MTVCAAPDCIEPARCTGLCKFHYKRQWRTGRTDCVGPSTRRGSIEERFWRHTDKRGLDECWPWTGYKDKDGYGTLKVGTGEERTSERASRVSYRIHNGPIPPDRLVRHTCNNAPCVNPAHIILGTHDDNMRDRVEAGHYAAGEAHPMAKVSDATVAEILLAKGGAKNVGERFGLSASQVRNIRRGDQRVVSLVQRAPIPQMAEAAE